MEWVKSISTDNDPWFIAFVVLFVLLGILRQSEGERLMLFIRSIWNTSLLTQQVRHERTYNRIMLPVALFVFLSLAVFCIQAGRYFNVFVNDSFLISAGIVLLVLILAALIRGVVYSLSAYLFNLGSSLRLLNLQWLQLNFLLALVLLPLSVLVKFGPTWLQSPLIIGGCLLIGLTYIIRSTRVFATAQSELQTPLIYNVLYLCALEIVPPILLVVSILRQAEG